MVTFRLVENITFQVKSAVATFRATFGKLWATFNFNIWSHCTGWFAGVIALKVKLHQSLQI